MTIPPLSLGITKGVEWLKALNAEMFTYGQAHGYMNKSADHASVHALAGRLQAGPNGNLELTVPSSLIKGVFDALDEPGAEFVVRNNRTESAIKVMTKEEVDKLGGTSHISERGHSYHYTLGPIVELPASGEYDKLWAISIKSDDLEDIRRSYGLEASPQLGFYIPVGCKKSKVTEDNKVSKLAGLLKSSELVNANYNTTSLGRGTTLHHNTIEDYWPVGVPGHDKPLWLLKSRSQGHNQGPITSYALLPKNGNELAPNLGHEVANPMAYIALSEGVPGWDESPLGEYGPASEVVGLKTEIPHRRKGLASALIGFASNFENRNLYVEPDPIGDKAVARGDVEKAYLKNGFMKLDDKDPNAPLILRNYKPTSSPTLSKLASDHEYTANDPNMRILSQGPVTDRDFLYHASGKKFDSLDPSYNSKKSFGHEYNAPVVFAGDSPSSAFAANPTAEYQAVKDKIKNSVYHRLIDEQTGRKALLGHTSGGYLYKLPASAFTKIDREDNELGKWNKSTEYVSHLPVKPISVTPMQSTDVDAIPEYEYLGEDFVGEMPAQHYLNHAKDPKVIAAVKAWLGNKQEKKAAADLEYSGPWNEPELYHGSPKVDLQSLSKGSYVTPDLETAKLMGRFHEGTGKTWTDDDLEEPHYFGKQPKWKAGREPKGEPAIYRLIAATKKLNLLDNPYEHTTLEELPVSKLAGSVEDPMHVYSYIPSGSIKHVKEHGLLSGNELAKPENRHLLDIARPNGDADRWLKEREEKLIKSPWANTYNGPSVLFGGIDTDKINDMHPIKKFNTTRAKINLHNLLKDYPATKMEGSELIPFSNETYDALDEKGQNEFINKRHHTLSPEEIRALIARGQNPKDMWKDFKDTEGRYYASDVPHAKVVTPMGKIPSKYIEFEEESPVSKLAGLLKQSMHWSDDVSRDLLNGRHYPMSYLTGELGELGESVKNMDWTNFKEELGDSAYAAQMILAQKSGLNLPLIGASGPVDKFYARRKGWQDIFKERGVPFSNDYLAGGSNLKKPKKIQAALGLAGHPISQDDARAFSLKHGGGIEDDWVDNNAVSKLASLLKLSSNDQSIGAPNSTPPIKPISLPSHSPPSGMPAPSIPQGTDFNAMYTNFQNNNPNAPVPQRPVSPMAPSPTPMPNLAAQQANDQLSGNVPIPGVPQDPRGGKYEAMARVKHYQEAANTNVANLKPGTVAAERSKQQKDSEGAAISIVASAIPAGRMISGMAKGIMGAPVVSNNIPNIINTASGGTTGTTLGNTWRAANLQGLTKYKTLKYGIPAVGVASTAVPAATSAIKSTVSGGIPSPYPKWMNNIPDIKEAPFSVRTGDNATIGQLGSFAMDATRSAVGHATYKGLESFSSSNKGSSNPLTYLPSAQISKATSKAVAGKAMPFLSSYADAPDYANIARDNASKRLGIQTGGIAGEIPGAFGLPSFKLNNLAPYVSQPIKDVVNAYQIPSPIKVESNPYFLKEVANKVTPNLGTAAYDAMFPNKNNAPAPASYARPTSYADMRNTKYPSAPTPAVEPPLRKFLGEQAKTIGTRISDNLIPPRPAGQKPATMFPQIR